MKFFDPIPESYSEGAKRVVSWFAFQPVKIGNETRWLETVRVEQSWFDGYGALADPGWVNERFL